MITALAVIIALSVLIITHEAGHFFAAKMLGVKVEEFGIGIPPRIASFTRGGTRYSINALPFGGFVKLAGEFDGAFVTSPAWKRAVILVAGVFMNVVLAWALFSVVFMVGMSQNLVIASVTSGSPAETAGVHMGDVILGAESAGRTLDAPVTAERFIAFTGGAGDSLELLVKRNGAEERLTLAPRENPPAGEGRLGLELVDMGVSREPFFLSMWHGAQAAVGGFVAVAVGFATLISRAFSEPGVLDAVSGPVGVFVVAKAAGALGAAYLLELTAVISVNLAVLNLVPFPALDGGRLLFVLFEKLRGKPLSARVHTWSNAVGFALLIALMVIVTVKDLGKFVF